MSNLPQLSLLSGEFYESIDDNQNSLLFVGTKSSNCNMKSTDQALCCGVLKTTYFEMFLFCIYPIYNQKLKINMGTVC